MSTRHTVTVSVRNQADAWEIIERENNPDEISLSDIEVYAEEIGGPVGQELLLELRDEDDRVVESIETQAL